MAQLRLALAQLNPTVGDLDGNVELALESARTAAEHGAHLLVLPEMFLTGYPIEDLALRLSFIEASRRALDGLTARLVADGHSDLVVIVGYLDRLQDAGDEVGQPRHAPQNAVAVIHGGEVKARYVKHHLPNYGVFDEFRYFVPGTSPCIVRVHDVDIALAICEDLWQDGGPVAEYAGLRPGLLVVPNGSPYERNKDDVRLALARRRAAEAGCTLAYLNMVGAQDELVFDGDSIVVSSEGVVLGRTRQFSDEVAIVDLDLPARTAATTPRCRHRRRPGRTQRADRRVGGTTAQRRRRGLWSARRRRARLRAQERLHVRRPRVLGGHRLGPSAPRSRPTRSVARTSTA